MTDIPQAMIERVARAYDREDSALRGEQDPWSVDTEGPDLEEWKAERLSCATAAMEAMLEGVVLEWSAEWISSPFPYQIHTDNGGSGAPDDPLIEYENFMVFEPILMNAIGPKSDGSDQFETIDQARSAALSHYRTQWLKAAGGE